ncbi:alpha/beta hydrolase [Marinicellulosiphila megalodicopiae]|uniref:alpha/beta hydrolase n=1 Tax=Marinicellulosiphila megalodicopiae TaxID=2724896 RepID=UPI003BAF5E56
MLKKSMLLFTLLVSSGCAKIGLFVANVPAKFSNNQQHKNISYGSQPWQLLDIYIPEPSTTKNIKTQTKLPVVIFFYGGSFEDGNKQMYQFMGEAFANKGYITVIADYEKFPKVKFPEFIQDGAKAVAWVHQFIEQYGGDSNQLYISGHSAGAYIGAMICANNEYLAPYGLDHSIINAFAGLAGPYDFEPNTDNLKAIFSPVEDDYSQMQVTHFIEGNEPAMLLIWGEQDKLVYRRNIELLSNKIIEKNGLVTTKFYTQMNHVDMIKNMMWMLPTKQSILDEIIPFFELHTTK